MSWENFEINDLKRCGNCKYYLPCTYDGDICRKRKYKDTQKNGKIKYKSIVIEGDDYCDKWEFDEIKK